MDSAEWDTYSTVVPPLIMESIFSSLLAWKAASPTERISSTIKISGSTMVATEKASLAVIPEEKFFTGTSIKSCSSEKSTISWYLLRINSSE